jgi:hypothetical protein
MIPSLDVVASEVDQHLPTRLVHRVDLQRWAFSFTAAEMSALEAIRDAACQSPDDLCPLTVREIAALTDLAPRVVARAITVAIAAGMIEREGPNLKSRMVRYND